MTNRRFQILVKPRAAKDEIVGWREGVLHVRVRAHPVEGAANKSVVKLLARHFGIPPSSIEITGGKNSRFKRVVVTSDKELSLSLQDKKSS